MQEEAVAVARNGYAGSGEMQSVELLTETNNHHEYREQSLPAYAMTIVDARRSTVYVAAKLGTVQKIKNRPWRRFDFLWMLHTMDYSNRDNITNWVLRAFSIFGLATVVSGFTVFFVSRRKKWETEKRIFFGGAQGLWQFLKMVKSRQILVSNH